MSEQLKPCPFCGGEAEHDSMHYDGSGDVVHGCGHAVYCTDINCAGCPPFSATYPTEVDAINAWNARSTPAEASEIDANLDKRMIAAGMIPLSTLLSEATLGKYSCHAGVRSVDDFGEWVAMKHREYMTMRMRYEPGDKSKDDDLYEWVLSHAGAFGQVADNFRQAIQTRPEPGTAAQRCEAGCVVFDGGERKHHKDCAFYKDSRTEMYDVLQDKCAALVEALEWIATLPTANSEKRDVARAALSAWEEATP